MDDKSVLIVGIGRTGQAVKKFFEKRKVSTLSFDDRKEADFACVKDIPFHQISFVVQSPGVSKNHPVFREAKKQGIEVFSDLDVFVQAVKGATIVGITGTNGKSTTTALTNHILRSRFENVFMGGNIGEPVLSLPICQDAFYVLEISSFQLELSHKLNLDIAALTNITPDHLDRHQTMEGYAQEKAKIFDGAKYAVVVCDDIWTKRICDKLEGKMELKEIFFDHNPLLKDHLRGLTPLLGDHNLQNVAVSCEIARWLGVSEKEIEKSAHSFQGLPHRIEFIGEHQGISFYNDSKATNADSLIQALKSFPDSQIFLITGGRAKSDGIKPAVPFMHNVKDIFLIGEATDRFQQEISFESDPPDQGAFGVDHIHRCGTLSNAVKQAFEFAKGEPGKKVILLSPACASFDQFSNFEERGDCFKAYVYELMQGK